MKELPGISIVVIGFNEADNLINTFNAIQQINYPIEKIEVIYVDSGSTDDSVAISKKFADKVFIENMFPSAGRNRNRGLVEAQYDIVHFIDGDVIIDPNYLRDVLPLFEGKNAHAIVGQIDEQKPNIFNRMSALTNIEKKEGYTFATSTGATYLKQPLLKVNGYDERIKRGQESELGERFRKAGYKIWCTANKMGSHNFGVSNLRQYLKKYQINARSLLQVALIHGDSDFIKSAKMKVIKQILKFVLMIVFSFLSFWFNTILYIIVYLLVAWLLRNKSFFIKKFTLFPLPTFLRSIIDFFFYWIWWLGFFQELKNYFFDNKIKEFYQLKKMQLVKDSKSK